MFYSIFNHFKVDVMYVVSFLYTLILSLSLISCVSSKKPQEVFLQEDPLFLASYNNSKINPDILSEDLKEKIYSVEENCYQNVYELFKDIVIDTYIQEVAAASNLDYKEAKSKIYSSMGFSFLGLNPKEQTDTLYDKISKEKNVSFYYKRDRLPKVDIKTQGFPRIYSPNNNSDADSDSNTKETSDLIPVVVYLSLSSSSSKDSYDWLSKVKDDPYLKDKIEIIYKYCPLSTLSFVISLEKALNCSFKQGLFNEYLRFVYDNLDNISGLAQNHFVSSIGLDETKFNECMRKKFDELDISTDEVKRYSIQSVPTFFIDGRKHFNINSVSDLSSIIKNILDNK